MAGWLPLFVPDVSTFRGNPNVAISAIDTSGGIVLSRTSGTTPCFVQVSASAITATGTSAPYEDLEYSWDFGDPSGVETFTDPGTTGGTVNANTAQKGPEAVYCYRSAGTYTVTLTVRGLNGSVISTTKTATVTVSAFTPATEYWFDSVGGSDSNNGLSSGAPKQTLSALNTLISDPGDNARFNIKRGSSYTGALRPWAGVAGGVSRTGLRIQDYGSGAKPIFTVSSGTTPTLDCNQLNGGSSSSCPKDDFVVSGIDFRVSGGTPSNTIGIYCGHTSAVAQNIYLDNCDMTLTTDVGVPHNVVAFQSAGAGAQPDTLVRFGMWKCVNTSPQSVGSLIENMGVFSAGRSWFFIVGGSITGGTGSNNTTLSHHIYPDIQQHSLYRWITFGSGPNRSYCLNLNWSSASGSLEYAEYILMADNEMTGTGRAHDAGNATNDTTTTQYRNLVCERNRIHGLREPIGILYFANAISYTHRYNNVWDNTGRYFTILDGPSSSIVQVGSLLKFRFYKNKIYIASGASAGFTIDFGDAGWTQLMTISDNIFQDMRTTSEIMAIPFTQQSGAPINRNRYYAPNSSDSKYIANVTTRGTLATLWGSGFDLAGVYGDPGWSDPANGVF